MKADAIFDCLDELHGALVRHGIWHALAFGTLLGAVRDGDILAWDDDFDLFVRPADIDQILGLEDELFESGITFQAVRRPGTHLALSRSAIDSFWGGAVTVFRSGKKLGDLFAFQLFKDGMLRRYDFDREVYWSPHSSFPAWFVEATGEARLRGKAFPTPQQPEKWLELTYGPDWRTPIRSLNTGGAIRPGENIYGHRCAPRLAEAAAWCKAQGWDDQRYLGEAAWPREIIGAGPLGPVPRTKDNSRSLWWRDLDELIDLF